MRRLVVLNEYQRSSPTALSILERDTIRKLVPGLVIEPISGSDDTYTMTGGSSVGVIRVGDLTIELRPKVGAAPLLFMLSYAISPTLWKQSDAQIATDATLVEAMVTLFNSAVQTAIRPGLLHGYEVHQDTLTTVRGRVRMAEQMRNRTGLPLPIEVQYDEYTPDILENRLLRSALQVLGSLRLRHRRSAETLNRIHHQLHGITPVKLHGRSIPEPHWTRLNERYRPAISLARLILSNSGLEAKAGSQNAQALVVDMNAVFEEFIRVAVREELKLGRMSFPSGRLVPRIALDDERTIWLQPDLSWWHEARCIFVGDCKYKKTTGGPPSSDAYQMLAYLTALDLDEGLLIYAAGEEAPREVTISAAGKRIHIRTVRVAEPPEVVLQQIKQLAGFVRHLTTETTKVRAS